MPVLTPCLTEVALNLLSENTDYSPLLVSSGISFLKLSKLNKSKAHGPDYITAWLLKENADILAEHNSQIINTSFRESHLPLSWKRADVVPIPKQKPVEDINKHLRSMSLTPIISKIAEEYIVNVYVKPSVLEQIDPQQFGTIPQSSTTQALISMIEPGQNLQMTMVQRHKSCFLIFTKPST